MIRRLKHWYYLAAAGAALAGGFAYAAVFFAKHAANGPGLPAGTSLNTAEIRRWRHYFFGTTYLRIVFTLLHGTRVSQREMRLFSQLSALAGFFDDLSDAFRRNGHAGTRWQDDPERYARVADARGLALHLLHLAYRALPPEHLPPFKQYMLRVFNLETSGRQQTATPPPTAELARITAEKGGYSVLLFRLALDRPLSEAERQALLEFGHLVQLCDDIFDLWFDRQSGTHTLATVLTTEHAPDELERVFEAQVAATRAAFRSTAFPGRRVERALMAVHYLVGATRSCLSHYRRLQKERGVLPFDNRRAMVPDMARWSNRLRAALHVVFDWDKPEKS